jgi:O-antigen/teichoic acid export membrane protein
MRMAAFILLPLNTRYLSPADYGVLELIEQIGLVLSVLLGLSFSSALGYFYNAERDESRRSLVLSTTLIGSLLVGFLAALAVTPLAGMISELAYGNRNNSALLAFALAALPLSFLLEAGFTWIRVADRPLAFLGASVLRVVVTIILSFTLLAGFGLRLWGVVLSSVGAIAVVALVLTIAFIRENPLRFDRVIFGRMMRYSVPLGLSGVAMFIIHFGDRFLLPRYRPIEELGWYSLAYKMAMLLSLIYGSFHAYWTAQIYQIIKREDARIVFARIFTYVCMILCFCSLGFFVACHPVIRILTAPAFHRVADLVPLLVLAYFLRSIGDFFRCLFLANNHPGYENICNWVGAVFCLGGYFLWIPRYGMWGAASATLLAFAVVLVISLVWTARVWPYHLEARRLGILFGTTVLVAALHYWIDAQSLSAQIWTGIGLLLILPAVLWVTRFLTPGELEMLGNARNKVRSSLGLA